MNNTKKVKIDIKIAYIGNIKNKIKQNNLYKNLILILFFIIKNAYISINLLPSPKSYMHTNTPLSRSMSLSSFAVTANSYA